MSDQQIVVRQNIWELDDEWADPVLWYARGVKEMQARPLDDPTSWRFYAAIHGIFGSRWRDLGYLRPTDAIPPRDVQRKFWQQCQHGSWYFLPWHRGYLLAFEATVRAAVVALGGPEDWALPYWNYFKPGQAALPTAFALRNWPDGENDNPLFVEQRWGPNNDGDVFVPIEFVNLDALNDPDFTGVASGGSPGFGGVDTGFEHGGATHGALESQPHDWVHGLVGGADPTDPMRGGVMSDPDTAGLDPIFWLHHANIDRLWATWRRDELHLDPTEDAWLDGPDPARERPFVLPLPDDRTFAYTPRDMIDPQANGYAYDDLEPGPVAPPLAERPARPEGGIAATEGAAVADGDNVELVGANRQQLAISGGDAVRTSVRIDRGVRDRVTASLTAGADEGTPDRVFLNLENVRGRQDSAALRVYVGLADDADPADHPERLAGSVALFGVRKATDSDDEHGGQGLTFVMEITKIVDQMRFEDGFDVDDLEVLIVPFNPVPEAAQVRIGRVSVFRQGR
jgi:tyrosinase